MKRIILLTTVFAVLFGGLIGCVGISSTTTTTTEQPTTGELESVCKDTPLANGCYTPSGDLNHISPIVAEYVITETFETEMLNQMPMNWLLYTNAEYEVGGVLAKVVADPLDGLNQAVQMYSDGLKTALYPQGGPQASFIFTSKFNLDQTRTGVMYVDVMIPSTGKNSVTVGVSTGAVNAISITIGNNLALTVKTGGPFYFARGTGDGGTYHTTGRTLETDHWYCFKFTWDAAINLVAAFLMEEEIPTLMFSGPFDETNRVNAENDGEILVPNVVRVTMPKGQAGTVYLDNVIVERPGDGE